MSEIFISYASADRDTARALAQFLERQSCSVFWDRTIPPGRTWDEVLEKALREARAVIVLWSKAAVASEWVKAEAGDAASRRILVPAIIETVELPLRFRAIQAADLTTWNRTDPTADLGALLDSIGDLLGRKMSNAAPEPRPIVTGATSGPHPIPALAAESRQARQAVLRALAYHLLLGTGLFRVAPGLKRKWIYVAAPSYAIVDVALARMGVDPFSTDEFGASTFIVALIIYGLSFIDVGLTRYRRWKLESTSCAHAGDFRHR